MPVVNNQSPRQSNRGSRFIFIFNTFYRQAIAHNVMKYILFSFATRLWGKGGGALVMTDRRWGVYSGNGQCRCTYERFS